MTDASVWKKCSTCKSPIALKQAYYACSVSTCNRARSPLVFCNLRCWEAHVPVMNHREAWAEERRAPASLEASESKAASDDTDDVLVVVTKVKAYIRERSGMSTSDSVMQVLTKDLKVRCQRAIKKAGDDGRKTVFDRDFEAPRSAQTIVRRRPS